MNKRIFCLLSLLLPVFGAQATVVEPDSLKITEAASVFVQDMLSGKASGVFVGNLSENLFDSPSVIIRGLNSLRTDNQPLWIVDGVELSSETGRNSDPFWQYDGDQPINALNPLSFLSPEDIESIEVLKDVSATAIYGSRGANGVVIVRTKKASARKFSTEWSSNLGVVCNPVNKKPSVSNNHHLSVSGSVKGTGYYVRGNYRDDRGIVDGNKRQIFNALAGLNTSAGEKIKFGINTVFSGGTVSSPLALIADYDDTAKEYRGLLSTYLHFNVKKFSFKLDAGADYFRSDRGIWYGKDSEFGACTVLYPDGGAGSMLTTNCLSYNAKLSAEYHTYIASEHKIDAVVSAKVYGDSNTLNAQNGRNFINHSLKAKGLNYKATLPLNRNFDYSMCHPALQASLSYGWKDNVGLNAGFEYDYNTRFKSSNTKKFYPTIAAYADFAKIFKINSKTVSKIHIDAGWGKSGKDVFAPYEWFGLFVQSGYPVPDPGTEMFFNGLETLTTTEGHIGGTVGFMKDRFTVSLKYYDRKTKDSFAVYNRGGDPVDNKGTIYLKYVDPVEVFRNTADVINKGYEFDVNLGILRKSRLRWDLSLTGAYSQNNYPVGRVIGYRLDENGKPIDQTGEGRITKEDMVELGRSVPVWYGGLCTELCWDKLSFVATISGAQGMIADFLKMDLVGFNYRLPVKTKSLKSVDLRLAGRNLFVVQGADTPYDYMKSIVLGATIKF